ncbi:MAG: four helix bundle protein [Paludibacteraceae bacterium]|jgi:four helix bundle protein|nr:four helix bundle protein [Paludibacteraceae bacterium]
MNNSVTHIKTKAFAVRIIKFYKYLTQDKKEFVLAKQILRSGTSIGANVRESYSAQSNADFIHKLQIALKEADETAYWLELFVESEIITEDMFNSLSSDLKEISSLLAASIKTLKQKNNL